MIPFVLGATVAIFLSSLLLALFIARPLEKLAVAADKLRLSGSTRLSLPDVSRRNDEIGQRTRERDCRVAAFAVGHHDLDAPYAQWRQ